MRPRTKGGATGRCHQISISGRSRRALPHCQIVPNRHATGQPDTGIRSTSPIPTGLCRADSNLLSRSTRSRLWAFAAKCKWCAASGTVPLRRLTRHLGPGACKSKDSPGPAPSAESHLPPPPHCFSDYLLHNRGLARLRELSGGVPPPPPLSRLTKPVSSWVLGRPSMRPSRSQPGTKKEGARMTTQRECPVWEEAPGRTYVLRTPAGAGGEPSRGI